MATMIDVIFGGLFCNQLGALLYKGRSDKPFVSEKDGKLRRDERLWEKII
jgi:hypothetical protein